MDVPMDRGLWDPEKKMASHSMAAIHGGDPKHVLFHWDDPPRYPAVGVSKLKLWSTWRLKFI